VVIEPDVADIGWDSFVSAQRLVEMGEKAALAALPAIQEWLEGGGESGVVRASTGARSRAIVPQTA
jgi:hypothetical protein